MDSRSADEQIHEFAGTGFLRFAGWSAIGSAAATILGLVTLMVFYGQGQPWGTINDVTSIVLALSLSSVLLVLHRMHRHRTATLSLAAVSIGLAALCLVFLLQTLLVLRILAYAQTAASVPSAFAVFGATLMVYGYLNRSVVAFPAGWARLGILAGAGYVLVLAGIILGGQEHALTEAGGLLAVVCYPIWAVWFGRRLLLGQITVPS